MKICKKCIGYEDKKDYLLVHTNCVDLHIWQMTTDILRIRAGFDGDFAENSYSLVTTAWEDATDTFMEKERKRIKAIPWQIAAYDEYIDLQGERLKVRVHKNPFYLEVFDTDGECIHRDVCDLTYQEDGNGRRLHASEINPEDYFYGFGEKSGHLNKAQKFLKMAPRDAMGYNPKETDSLYKHIPFYIRLKGDSKHAVGYFYHNTAECDFDMGREKSNYWHMHSLYRTDAGDIDLFLIAGPRIGDVISRYTDLTGKSAMLPKQALGYLGSSMYYAELDKDCDEAILGFMDTAQKENIPMDGFMLSSGYTSLETEVGLKRCVFEWNRDRFKSPENFFAEAAKRGIAISPNVKPGILTCHPRFLDMAEKGMFVKDSEEETPGIGTWWGGPGAFVDFTNDAVRQLWKKDLKEALLKKGATSIWNDNCEYDSLVDKDCRVSLEGKGSTIGTTKAIMSNLMCRITRDAMEEVDAKQRPFVVCRSGHAGIQRYAQTWAGDNLTCWEALKYNIATILGMGLSGVANQGCDIGGFYGPAPEAELFVRWVQNGIFQPRFSIHSVNIDNTVTEPWMYEQVTPLIRQTIWLRYEMMPYLYSLMYRAHETGLPIMQALSLVFQKDEKTYGEDVDFMFGDGILVANVVEKGQRLRQVYLPQGEDFYDFWTGDYYRGGQTISVPVTLASIPMFVRAGSIVPMTEDHLHPLATAQMEQLTLRVAPGRDTTFTLYEDDGVSNDYLQGDYRKTEISLTGEEVAELHFRKTGKYLSSIKNVKIDFHAPEKAPLFVQVADKEVKHYLYKKEFEEAEEGWFYDMDMGMVVVKYPEMTGDYDVRISFKQFDMIGM